MLGVCEKHTSRRVVPRKRHRVRDLERESVCVCVVLCQFPPPNGKLGQLGYGFHLDIFLLLAWDGIPSSMIFLSPPPSFFGNKNHYVFFFKTMLKTRGRGKEEKRTHSCTHSHAQNDTLPHLCLVLRRDRNECMGGSPTHQTSQRE